MKKSVYDKLEDIPQIDRDENNYSLVTDSKSANFNKYVLLLDGAHPVQTKNVELLSEKQTEAAKQQTVIAQKDVEISRLTGELATAKTAAPALPAGQVAVTTEDAAFLAQVKPLGDFKTIKEKIDEHGTLKTKEQLDAQREKLTEIAKRNGMEPEAFVKLAMDEKLQDSIDQREIDDGKGGKVKHDFVKTKDAAGADKVIALGEFVKENTVFKPFLGSLYLSEEDKKRIRIPNTKVGEKVEEKSAADAYLNSVYTIPEAK